MSQTLNNSDFGAAQANYSSEQNTTSERLGTEQDDAVYKMNGGKLLIFNHENFDNGFESRKGTEIDSRTLKDIFTKLGFHVDQHNDKEFAEMFQILQTVSDEDHSETDCLIIAILTHGSGGGTLYAKDCSYNICQIVSLFTARRCHTLAGKPKIFFIQACRMSKQPRDTGMEQNAQFDATTMFSPQQYIIPVEVNFLFAFSTQEGRLSYRDDQEGTWFIQEVCKELSTNARRLNLVTMLTNVARLMAFTKGTETEKQMPVIQTTLTYKLFFNSPNR